MIMYTLFYPPKGKAVKNIALSQMKKYVTDEFESYWFNSGTSDAVIQCFENNEHISDMTIGTNIEHGIFLHYISRTEDKLSLYDETRLNNVIDGANCQLYVSEGLFLPEESAWKAIREFLETGTASEEIEWISPDDLPEEENYF